MAEGDRYIHTERGLTVLLIPQVASDHGCILIICSTCCSGVPELGPVPQGITRILSRPLCVQHRTLPWRTSSHAPEVPIGHYLAHCSLCASYQPYWFWLVRKGPLIPICTAVSPSVTWSYCCLKTYHVGSNVHTSCLSTHSALHYENYEVLENPLRGEVKSAAIIWRLFFSTV